MTSMPHPEVCIQCGTCVSVCPVEMVGGHAIVTFLADPDTADFSVWLCSSCWRCHEACPVGVDIYGLMMAWRRREPAPPLFLASYERVLSSGLSLPVDQESLDELRADRGLERVELASLDLALRLLEGDG